MSLVRRYGGSDGFLYDRRNPPQQMILSRIAGQILNQCYDQNQLIRQSHNESHKERYNEKHISGSSQPYSFIAIIIIILLLFFGIFTNFQGECTNSPQQHQIEEECFSRYKFLSCDRIQKGNITEINYKECQALHTCLSNPKQYIQQKKALQWQQSKEKLKYLICSFKNVLFGIGICFGIIFSLNFCKNK